MAITNEAPRVLALVGGVGGAKLALGLQGVLPEGALTVVVNTADDMWHYSLRICPDVDTVLYTLSGRVDPVNGWGVAGDSVTTLETLRALGAEAWFRLGDKDMATHLLRTHMLREGATMTQITAHLAGALGVKARVLPMSDDFIETRITTTEYGTLGFQEYFVKHRWQATVTALAYEGADVARMTPQVRDAIAQADVIFFAPSNPFLSIAPILSVPNLREALLERRVPRIAVSPIVAGQAIKGPAAKIMRELGMEASAQAVAQWYGALANGFAYDVREASFAANVNGQVARAFDTMMITTQDKERLARELLAWAQAREIVA